MNMPRSGKQGIIWNSQYQKWVVFLGEHRIGVFASIREAEAAQIKARSMGFLTASPEKRAIIKSSLKKKTQESKERCKQCRWSGRIAGAGTDGYLIICLYSSIPEHDSRVFLHYKRVGKEDLSTFTTNTNCTEFEPKEGKKQKKTTVTLNIDKFMMAKGTKTWATMANELNVNRKTLEGYRWKQAIPKTVARKIFKTYGIDVTDYDTD